MIFGLSWIFCGLSLMDCLWNVCGLLGMDFSLSLIGFPQPFVCVWAGRASHGHWRDGRALLALILCIYTGFSIWYSFSLLHYEMLQKPQYNCKKFRYSYEEFYSFVLWFWRWRPRYSYLLEFLPRDVSLQWEMQGFDCRRWSKWTYSMPRQLPGLPTGDWTLVGCDFNRIEVSLFRLPYNGEVKADDAVSMPYLLWHGECQGRVTEFVLNLSRTSSKGGVKNHPMYS